jgi:hypothetical protein
MPAIPITGTVQLGDTLFTTNPAVYKPLEWEARLSEHMEIGGTRSIQFFGVVQADDLIVLESGQTQILSQAAVIALFQKWQTGATYPLTDWLGNSFMVLILDFKPVNYRPDLYHYTMRCRVTQIVALWGTPYSGS